MVKELWRVRIDPEISARVKRYLTDPVRGKPKKGTRSDLVEELLVRWLHNMDNKKDMLNDL